MIYNKFQDKSLPMLGFGAMRLPTNGDGSINKEALSEMVDTAMENGVNYFDTAYPYHGGMSEICLCEALKKYDRASYYLADKYPGHQIAESYNPAEVFEHQLQKCGVEYFDFYLLHNVYENSMSVYLDEKWGILDYFKEQKKLGRIKHLGFSTHAGNEALEKFLDIAGKDMEFCQIQLNWVDWTLQNAKEKVEILNRRSIPVWVMEPVRGGKLCSLDGDSEATLKSYRPDESVAAWGFRFLQDIKGVTVVLSGMSNISQMKENIKTFKESKPLSSEERGVLLGIAEKLKTSVPCTACRYCVAGCPKGLDIPKLISTYNELLYSPSTNAAMWIECGDSSVHPDSCISCGKCTKICPQNIDIPQTLKNLSEKLKSLPKWKDICKVREEEAKRSRGETK